MLFYSTFENLIKIRLSDLRELIRKGFATEGQGVQHRATLTLNENSLYGQLSFALLFDGERLQIKWEDTEGKQRQQSIWITTEPSNLMAGRYVPYFLCNGYRCRTLYGNGQVFCSRKQLPFIHYSSQKESRTDRIVRPRREPYRDFGKPYYRGELTPYGRKILKHEQREDSRAEAMLSYLNNLTSKYAR